MIGFRDLKEGMLQFDKADRCKVSGRHEGVGCKMRDLQCACLWKYVKTSATLGWPTSELDAPSGSHAMQERTSCGNHRDHRAVGLAVLGELNVPCVYCLVARRLERRGARLYLPRRER
jgi:hypothetical protein